MTPTPFPIHPLETDIDEEERMARNPSRVVLPAVPPALSEALCLLNCFAPGLGTFLSSISCCCAKTRGMSKMEIVASVFVGMFIALLQLILTPLLLIGWVWSCFWGLLLTAQSDVYFKPRSEQERTPHGLLQNPLSGGTSQTHAEPPPPYTFYDDYFQRGISPPPPYSPEPQQNGGPPQTTSPSQPPATTVVFQPPRTVERAQENGNAVNAQARDPLPLARVDTIQRPDRPSSAPTARVHYVSENQNGTVTVTTNTQSNSPNNSTQNGLPDIC